MTDKEKLKLALALMTQAEKRKFYEILALIEELKKK